MKTIKSFSKKFSKNVMVIFVLITMLSVLVIPVAASQYIFSEILMNNASSTMTYTNNGTYTSVNQMNEMILKGQAPDGFVSAHNGFQGQPPHIHMSDGSAINLGGSAHHGSPNLTTAQRTWLMNNGWLW